MPEPIIRPATAADAQGLADIGARTFTETFGSLYRPPDLAAFLSQAHSVERARRDLADPGLAVWLVEAAGGVAGYCKAGPCGLPHPQARPADGELKSLYLLRAHQGRGLGRSLLGTALAWLEREGPRPLWVGVWSENHGAQRLYRRHGFETVGDYRFPVGEARDLELIMRRRQATAD